MVKGQDELFTLLCHELFSIEALSVWSAIILDVCGVPLGLRQLDECSTVVAAVFECSFMADRDDVDVFSGTAPKFAGFTEIQQYGVFAGPLQSRCEHVKSYPYSLLQLNCLQVIQIVRKLFVTDCERRSFH